MLVLLLETCGEFRNNASSVTEDARAQTADCDEEAKSQYRREVAHARNPCTHEKLRLLDAKRSQADKTQKSPANDDSCFYTKKSNLDNLW